MRSKNTEFTRNCPSCNKQLFYSSLSKLSRAIKNNSSCQSCFAKQRANSEEYRKKLSSAVTKSWEGNKERKKQQSDNTINFWKNLSKEQKEEICKKMSERAVNQPEERKTLLRSYGKLNWSSKEFRDKWFTTNSKPEVSEKRRINLLNQINNPNSKINSIESKQKKIFSSKENWKNKSEEEKSKILDRLSKTLHSFHSKSRSTSKLEMWVLKNISHLGFKSKATIAGYCVDIIHETLPIVIEVNGDFWHANPKLYNSDWINNINKKSAKEIWENDNKRLQNIKNAGYEVIVLWQNDIKNNTNYILEIEQFISKHFAHNPDNHK